MARAALLLIRGYKLVLSPYFGGSCRFLPSCADYAAQAIAAHGLVRGTWLAARRLSRCHPLCRAGYDPVPAPDTNIARPVPPLRVTRDALRADEGQGRIGTRKPIHRQQESSATPSSLGVARDALSAVEGAGSRG